VLDRSTLAEVQGLGPELLEEIVNIFVADVPVRLARLHSAFAAHQGDAIRKEAHGLKGGALGVGAARMADICAAIERYAGVGELAQASTLEPSVDPAFEEARRALEQLCRCRPTA